MMVKAKSVGKKRRVPKKKRIGRSTTYNQKVKDLETRGVDEIKSENNNERRKLRRSKKTLDILKLEEKRLSRLSINDGIIELEQENKSESEEEWNFSSEDDNNKKFNTENISDYKIKEIPPKSDNLVKVCRIEFQNEIESESIKRRILVVS